MQALKRSVVLSTLVILVSNCCEAQSNVYSVAIYSAGNSYSDLCSFDFPFPPHRFKLTQRSWFEDANGLTIIDAGREKERGGIVRRSIEVECGSDTFSIPLGSARSKRLGSSLTSPEKGSGDLAKLVMQCAIKRGGHATTNTLPVLQVAWVRASRELQDVIIVEGDHFTAIQELLEQAYGEPDAGVHSSVPPGNGRSVTYTPRQVGVVVNLTANSSLTIVSVIGRQKP